MKRCTNQSPKQLERLVGITKKQLNNPTLSESQKEELWQYIGRLNIEKAAALREEDAVFKYPKKGSLKPLSRKPIHASSIAELWEQRKTLEFKIRRKIDPLLQDEYKTRLGKIKREIASRTRVKLMFGYNTRST